MRVSASTSGDIAWLTFEGLLGCAQVYPSMTPQITVSVPSKPAERREFVTKMREAVETLEKWNEQQAVIP